MATITLPQFSEQFDGWQFPFSTVTEGQLISHARQIADIEFPEWNHRAKGDVGWMAVALYLKALSQGIQVANAWAQECNIFTAREEKMILAHARKLGYLPKSATPARVDALVTLPAPLDARTFGQYELKLTNRNAVGEENEVFFENEEAVAVGGGISQVTMTMIAGRSFEQVATSDGSEFQVITLNETPVIDGFTRVEIQSVFWEIPEEETLAYSGPTDKHFTVSLNRDGKLQVEFGNGIKGAIPPLGQDINVYYRTGGGDETNVPKNTLTYVYESPGEKPTAVTNPLKATGGEPKDTKAEIIRGAILQVRTRDFLGRLEEVDGFSEAFSGVARAKSILVGSQIIVGIIPSGGGVATGNLRSALQAALSTRVGMGYTVQVDNPSYVVPTVDVLFTTKPGFISAEVEAAVEADIARLLNPLTTTTNKTTNEIGFLRKAGQTLYLNEIRGVLDARPDIEKDFEIRAPAASLTVPADAFVTDEGATITATSRNVQTIGYTP